MTHNDKNPISKNQLILKKHNFNEKIDFLSKTKSSIHSKNPYRIKKSNPIDIRIKSSKILDGFYLLDKSACDLPHEIISIRLAGKNIVDIAENDLNYFINLIEIDLSENNLKDIEKLTSLKALEKLYVQNNDIENLNFSEFRYFEKLYFLDLSFNKINPRAITNLAFLPMLRELNLTGNELIDLPDDFSGFLNLEILNLSSNKFLSDHTAARLWAHLASIQKLRELDVSRNLLRGIHTEKLVAGDFANLEKLDFSYNQVENQHNLICTRNFKNLKMLIVTGNPFAVSGQHKGLEKEIYMKIGAALINDSFGLNYSSSCKKTTKLPIYFPKILSQKQSKLMDESNLVSTGIDFFKTNKDYQKSPKYPLSEEENEDEKVRVKDFIRDNANEQNENLSNNQREQQQEVYEINGSPSRKKFNKEEEGSHYRSASKVEKYNNNFDNFATNILGSDYEFTEPVKLPTAYKLLKQMVNKPFTGTTIFNDKIKKNMSCSPKKNTKRNQKI